MREAWKMFKDKMRPVRMWQNDKEEKTRRNNDLLTGINNIAEGITKIVGFGCILGIARLYLA